MLLYRRDSSVVNRVVVDTEVVKKSIIIVESNRKNFQKLTKRIVNSFFTYFVLPVDRDRDGL